MRTQVKAHGQANRKIAATALLDSDCAPELTDEQLDAMQPLVSILADWLAYFAEQDLAKAA